MKRKIISLFTLFAFIIFSLSCYTTRLREVRTATDLRGKKGNILSLVKTSGEYIEFSKNEPGQIYGDKIAGTAVVLSKKVEINQDNIKEVKRDKGGMISKITNKDGKIYHVVTGTIRIVSTKDDLTGKEEERIIFFTSYETYESITIPLTEVKSVRAEIKKFDKVKSFIIVLGVVGLGALALAAALRESLEWEY
jgi:hypothetical protein